MIEQPTQKGLKNLIQRLNDEADMCSNEGASDIAHLLWEAAAAVAASPAVQVEPVAWMWQHDDTGRTGFVDAWQLANGWREANPRLHVTTPLYAAPHPDTPAVPKKEA